MQPFAAEVHAWMMVLVPLFKDVATLWLMLTGSIIAVVASVCAVRGVYKMWRDNEL